MQRVDGVAREESKQALFNHATRATFPLFRRLENEMHSAVQIRQLSADARSGECHCDMPVVATGVHDAWNARGVRYPTLFLNRQAVHISADCDRSPTMATGQCADHTSSCEPSVYFQSEVIKLRCDEVRRLPLFVCEFGVLVNLMSPPNRFCN